MNFSDPTLLILLGLAAIGIISHNSTVTVAILVLLIIRLTPMEQYFSWVESRD
ncbi:MAG: hypothetical protein GPOALKHO_000185 [Sodalis sp.]|nr:MAG: hypothetical protein GPOALKHO_000185 [Sodalis sp.]